MYMQIFLPVRHKGKSYKILIADDDELVRDILVEVLKKKENYLVDEAINGIEACIKLGIYKPDLLILDILMPEMDGLEATKLIRSEDISVLNNEIPIIAMTAHAMKEDMEQCLAVGMNGYISKPVSQKCIAEAIEKIFV